MNGSGLLEAILKDILSTIYPIRDDWATRLIIIDQIRDVVRSMESLRGASVDPFGSFVSNLFTRWGDLDISIEVQNNGYITPAGKKRKQTLLVEVLRALRKKGGWHKMQFIANAKVPILKLESNYNNISCDISINNLSGQMKSQILFWINEIDGRFRDLVLLVKEWAKAHNINDPKSGSLNSYSLTLLVIFHLQTCTPAILPPLKDIYPGNMVEDVIGMRVKVEEQIKQTCELHINKFRANKSRRINRSGLSELFISFLAKFSDIDLRASTLGINLYTAQWEEIDTNMRWLPKTCALFIEDPFEQPSNTARTLSKKQLLKVAQAIRISHIVVTSHDSTEKSFMLSTLVRPQVAKLLPQYHQQNLMRYHNQQYYTRGDIIPRAPRPHFQYSQNNTRRNKNYNQNANVNANDAGASSSSASSSSYRPPPVPVHVQPTNATQPQTWRPKLVR